MLQNIYIYELDLALQPTMVDMLLNQAKPNLSVKKKTHEYGQSVTSKMWTVDDNYFSSQKFK